MKAIIALTLSTLVALLALTSTNCESESYERTRMPEKQWANYKVSNNFQKIHEKYIVILRSKCLKVIFNYSCNTIRATVMKKIKCALKYSKKL